MVAARTLTVPGVSQPGPGRDPAGLVSWDPSDLLTEGPCWLTALWDGAAHPFVIGGLTDVQTDVSAAGSAGQRSSDLFLLHPTGWSSGLLSTCKRTQILPFYSGRKGISATSGKMQIRLRVT